MNDISNAGIIVRSIGAILIYIYFFWITILSGYLDVSFFQGFAIFIGIMVVLLIVGGIPFAGTFSPIIFEWFFLGIPFNSISGFAWTATAVSFLSFLLISFGVFNELQKH
jgi:hypothetical protein